MKKPLNNLKNKQNTIMISFCVTLLFILFSIILLSKNYVYLLITAIAVLYLLLIYLIFKNLYTRLNLEKKISSFLMLFCNITILLSYIINMLFIFCEIPPIYLKDLTIFAQYKYFALVLLSIFCGLIFIINFYYPKLTFLKNKLRYVFLQHELKLLVDSRHKDYLESVCYDLFNFLEKKTNKYIYIFSHFVISCLTRIIILGYFVNFVFLNGNLVSLRYFLFLSFFLWILNFVFYYFDTYCEGTVNYVNDLVHVTIKQNLTKKDFIDTKYLTQDHLLFEITPFALAEGFQIPRDTSFLINSWSTCNEINVFLLLYKKLKSFINFIILAVYFICWCYIVFQYKENLNLLCFTLPGAITKPSFFCRISDAIKSMQFVRPYSIQPNSSCNWINKQHQKSLKIITEGAIEENHPVYGTPTPDGMFFIIEGSLTHGPASQEHPSRFFTNRLLNPTSTENRPTKIVPLPNPVKIPIDFVSFMQIKNSTAFLNEHKNEIDAIHDGMKIGRILNWNEFVPYLPD